MKADLRAEQAAAQRAILRQATADPRTPTPHNELRRGWYEMEWCGFRVVVEVVAGNFTVFLPPSGYPRQVATVPDARFYRLPEALQ